MIQFNCPGCDKLYQVPDEVAGKFAKCRECGWQMQVPMVLDGSLEIFDTPQPGPRPTAESPTAQQPNSAGNFPPPSKPQKMIHPSNPPKDPILMALLSGCCIAWLGQIVLGQTAKGLVMLAICVTLAFIGVGFVGWPLSAVDAYLTAKKLKEGQSVGEWEFFGSWSPF
ncbi:MAG: hypothetical protein WCJ35_14030 [Planctomycetota bacterium]